MFNIPSPVIILLVFAIPIFSFRGLKLFSCRGPALPGPRRFPFIGNVISTKRIWTTLAKLSKSHGPIYSLRILWKPMVVLNSADVALELLEGRSGMYWPRPIPKMVELAGMEQGVVFQPDAAILRQSRKLLNSVLHPRILSEYDDALNSHVNQLLNGILHTPGSFLDHIRHMSAGVTMNLSHGYELKGLRDPIIEMADDTVQNFSFASNTGGYVVDWFPFLSRLPQYLPGMGFKRHALEWKDQYIRLAETGHAIVKDMIKAGTAKPSLTLKGLQADVPVDEKIIMFTATQVYTGGADTTVSTLSSFFLAMARHPHLQKRAQAEIDSVVGNDRLPTIEDRAQLPYTNAVIKEVLRRFPPIPAVVRMPVEDDVYNGYTIRKGTTVVVNIWGMLHDSNAYPDPFSFQPERWTSPKLDSSTHDPLDVVFGFGRRICPGRHLAERLLFTTIACTLAAFDIGRKRDHSGAEITPPEAYSDGGLIFPLPFECTITPRSEQARRLIMSRTECEA